jgi:hypothetical protein
MGQGRSERNTSCPDIDLLPKLPDRAHDPSFSSPFCGFIPAFPDPSGDFLSLFPGCYMLLR